MLRPLHTCMKAADPISRARSQRPVANIHLAPPQRPLTQFGGLVATRVVKAAGRRRAVRPAVTLASFSGQGPYVPYGFGAGMPGPRRLVRRRQRDLQQLVDVLSGGAADDPEQFLQLLSSAPRVLERRRAPVPQPPPPPLPPLGQSGQAMAAAAANRAAAEQYYARQLQQQQQQAAEVRLRRQQEQEEEEHRREALRAAMLRNARRHLPQYDTPSLARLASGLAAAGIHDPVLCDDMLRQMMERRRTRQQQQQQQVFLEPRSLAELLDAFAAMRHRPTDAQLTELLQLQQQEQQQAVEQERVRQAQTQQQVLRSPPRLQPRGMAVVPEATQPAATGGAAAGSSSSSRMSPEDSARLLYALSRLGYSPDEGTLAQLLEQLQPQRLQLQPADLQQQQQQQQGEEEGVGRGAALAPAESPSRARHAVYEEATREEEEREDDVKQSRELLQDELKYSLQRDAQAVAYAVRALERMGRPGKAQQLREHFTRHVRDVQARVVREREIRQQQQEAAAAAAAERERRAAAEAEALREREMQQQRQEQQQRVREVSEQQRRQRQEEQAHALRQQLARQLRAADQWQQIRALLFTYQEALDAECLAAAAARLADLLAAARRTGRGLAMTLRERGELGDLMEGLGQLVLRRLEGASAAQSASLLSSVVRMRHLEEGLLVGLLRRLRATLDETSGGELMVVLRALAECGVRPSKPWMEAFWGRCEELLEQFSPEDLAALPVSLAQLGAHPGRSWLGTYLDVLQEREGELSQSAVSEAVRAVALLDRPFLSAWRQAAAVRQQQKQAQQQQQQALSAAAAGAAAAQQQQEDQRLRLQQQQQQPADALVSVDEMLARSDQWDEAVQEESLPSMHPKQRSMAEQQQAEPSAGARRQQQQQKAEQRRSEPATRPQNQTEATPRAASGFSRLPVVIPVQSIELDVDAANMSYGGDAAASAGSPSPPPTELAATATSAASAGPAARGGRQLPGSFSVDGFYSPEPYDEYDTYCDNWEDEIGEGEDVDTQIHGQEEVKEVGSALDARGASTAQVAEGGSSAEAAAAKAKADETAADEAVRAAAEDKRPTEQQQLQEEQSASAPPRQPTPDELSQARALRSLLLERYEAVAAYRDEVEERRRRAAAKSEAEGGEGGSEGPVSEREVAAAAKVLALQEQLRRLQADFDNFKRRASAEREQLLAHIKADTLRPLLSVADNFERGATQIRPKTEGERAVHNAYQAVNTELKEFLKKEGLQEVGVEGEAFDPNKHEAVMREDCEDVEDGTVTGVFQKGYRLGEVLVRPALVKVAYN